MTGTKSFGILTSGILLAAIAFVSGCGEEGNAEGPPEAENGEIAVNVRTLRVPRTTLREYLTISGPLRPITGTDVSTEETGVVTSIPRDKGAYVDKDETLVLLNRDLLEAEVRAGQAELSLRQYNEERTRKLREAKQVSEQEMRRAESEMQQARAKLDAARIRWERAAIKSPYAGIVADRFVEPGQLVVAGTPVVRVVDPFTLKLQSSVSEKEIRWIRPGASAAVTVGSGGVTRRGRVDWVSFEADPMTGKFQVEVHVENPDLTLKPGVVARAQVVKEVHADAVVIPRDAIVLSPSGAAVFVVEGDRARRRRVDLGQDQGLMTIVRDGLNQGEQLVVRGQRDLRDGSLVRIQQVATSPDGSTEDDPPEIRAARAFEPLIVEGAPEVETSMSSRSPATGETGQTGEKGTAR